MKINAKGRARMLIYLLFGCGFTAATAQSTCDDLRRQPELSWVAEYTTDFQLNPENEADDPYDPERLNYLDVIQFVNSNPENGLYGRVTTLQKYLSQQFLTDLDHRWGIFYEDSLVRNIMDKEAVLRSLTKIDTGIISCTGEMMIIRNEVSYEEIVFFRVRQVYWYNQKSKTFGARLLSYAPVVYTVDQEGNRNGTRALFWLKGEEPASGKFKNARYSYIFQTKTLNNAPRLQDFIVLKGAFDFKKYFAAQIKAPDQTLFDRETYQPLDPAALAEKCFGQDTIVTFDPETYAETVTLENRDCIAQIERIRLVQNWYFDEPKKRLYSRLTGIAPYAAIRDSDGNFRYLKPLFYLLFP